MKLKIVGFLIIMIFLFGFMMNIYINTDKDLTGMKDKIIRLHIIANSDSPKDQDLKLKVRDIVIKELGPKVKGLTDTNKAKAIIDENLSEVKETIQNEMEKLNESFPISMELEKSEFPTRTYGDLVFPKGEYQALKIKIGKGEGKNWWCVMFPPLCFVDIAEGSVSEKAIEGIEELLTSEELKVLKNSKEDIPVKFKLKIVELYKNLHKKAIKRIGKIS